MTRLSFADFPHDRDLDPEYHGSASLGVDMSDDHPALLWVKCDGPDLESEIEIQTPGGAVRGRFLSAEHNVHIALRESDIAWLIDELTALQADFDSYRSESTNSHD